MCCICSDLRIPPQQDQAVDTSISRGIGDGVETLFPQRSAVLDVRGDFDAREFLQIMLASSTFIAFMAFLFFADFNQNGVYYERLVEMLTLED